MSKTPELALYLRPTCPFCIKVLNYMERNGIEIPLKDISQDPNAASTLLRVGGKQQVPCLFIDGRPLYESSDIISWIQNNL